MKDPTNRTKVVIRHLPPTLSRSAFFEQIDSRFSGRYSWSSFRPGRTSHKGQKYARAYVNFNSPEDVIDFAEFFNGHVFVNEKGAQFKAMVEYSPSQRTPNQGSKKDGRDGTIFKDPEYIDFLEKISKPVENLPSADVQLERREAERAGLQEPIVVTPLMEFVRRRRASKTGSQVSSDGKSGGRVRTTSSSKPRSMKQSSDKKRYILKTGGKSTNGKEKSSYILLPRRDDQSESSSGNKLSDHDGNVSGDVGTKILLLKGKELEIPQVSGGMTVKKASAPSDNSSASGSLKLNHRHDASGKIIRSILMKGQSSSPSQSDQRVQILNSEKGKRPPRPSLRSGSSHASVSDQSPIRYSIKKRLGDDKPVGNESPVVVTSHEKHERRSRNKERHEFGIWAPRRSDASHGSDDRNSQTFSVSHEVNSRETKGDMHLGNRAEVFSPTGGHSSSHMENGSHRHYSRRTRDDGSPNEVKSSKRGAAGHGSHEKQVWVQKSASGS